MVGLGDWWEVGMGSECITVSNRKDEAITGEDRNDGYIKACDYLMSPNILMVINVTVHKTVRGREGRPEGEGEEGKEGQKKSTKKERGRREIQKQSRPWMLVLRIHTLPFKTSENVVEGHCCHSEPVSG